MSAEDTMDPVRRPKKTDPVTEHRLPAAVAVVGALVLYGFLADSFKVLPPWLVPALGVVALLPLIVLNPRRLGRETSWSRWLSIGFAFGLTLVNQVYIWLTLEQLLDGTAKGTVVLLSALQVWITNVAAFALVYWELDRGGPVARRIEGLRDDAAVDFHFPQQDSGSGTEDWRAGFIDYAYFSLSNMMAFSPTDVMPLTHRAKLLMGYQAVTGFVLLALVISRAVNILT
jgi:hypothetical protein